MVSPFERIPALVTAETRFAIATVVRTLGSTPQVVGAKLVVTDREDERPSGTLGGGCVEADALLTARQVLATGQRSLRAYELSEDLAWNTGLVCGGTMWILVEPGTEALGPDPHRSAVAVSRALAGGAPFAFVTRLQRDGRQSRFAGRATVSSDGTLNGSVGDAGRDRQASELAVAQMRHGTARLVPLAEAEDLLVEPVTGPPRLVIAGGGHVARAIARQALLLDYDVTVLEDRPEFADPARFDGARVVAGEIAQSIASLDYGWQSFLVIATRGHKLDADCVTAAVRTPVQYIGVLGSRRKTVMIEQRLRDEGVSSERVSAIHAPVGLDLGGRSPAEIALSVLAEITRLRYAGSGDSMRMRDAGARGRKGGRGSD